LKRRAHPAELPCKKRKKPTAGNEAPSFTEDTIVYAGRIMTMLDDSTATFDSGYRRSEGWRYQPRGWEAVKEVRDLLRAGVSPNAKRIGETLIDLAFKRRLIGNPLSAASPPHPPVLKDMADPGLPLDEIINLIIGHPAFDLNEVKDPKLKALLPALIPQAQFARASRAGDTVRMTQLLDEGLAPDLMMPRAVKEGSQKAVLLLVAKGADWQTVHESSSDKTQNALVRFVRSLSQDSLFTTGPLNKMADEAFESQLPKLMAEALSAAPNKRFKMSMALMKRRILVAGTDSLREQATQLLASMSVLVTQHPAATPNQHLRQGMALLESLLPPKLQEDPALSSHLHTIKDAAYPQQHNHRHK
jgi:hypothetical protein